MERWIFATLFVFTCSITAPSQTTWKLEKNSQGIKVYSADSGSMKFKSVKVECILEGTVPKLLEVLSDVADHKNWVYSTKNSYLLKKINEHELLYYAELDFSIFTRKRDVVIRMTVAVDSAHHVTKIFTNGEPGAIPDKDGLIRIPVFHARYEVSEVDPNHLRILYYSVADPGGSVPAWLTNMFVAKGPYNTFKNLAARLRR
jgi:hypothetical protein